jgi:hypothetical protein
VNRCPSCNFPVQIEWSVCRRCGTPLPLELRETSGTSARVPALPRRLTTRNAAARTTPARPVFTGFETPPDTLLPSARGGVPPTPRGPDTFIPPSAPPAFHPSPADRAASAIAAIREVVDRLVRRARRV